MKADFEVACAVAHFAVAGPRRDAPRQFFQIDRRHVKQLLAARRQRVEQFALQHEGGEREVPRRPAIVDAGLSQLDENVRGRHAAEFKPEDFAAGGFAHIGEGDDFAPASSLERQQAQSGDPVEILAATAFVIAGSLAHAEAVQAGVSGQPQDAGVDDASVGSTGFVRQRRRPKRTARCERRGGGQVAHRGLEIAEQQQIFDHRRWFSREVVPAANGNRPRAELSRRVMAGQSPAHGAGSTIRGEFARRVSCGGAVAARRRFRASSTARASAASRLPGLSCWRRTFRRPWHRRRRRAAEPGRPS